MLHDVNLVVAAYSSDFNIGGTTAAGGTADNNGVYTNMPFRIKSGFANCLPLSYKPKGSSICPPTSLFQMRYLEATFGAAGGSNTTDNTNADQRAGAKVRFPLDDVGNIGAAVQALKNCHAVCIDLVGEKWRGIPQVLGGKRIYTPSKDLIVLKTGQKVPAITGRFAYSSDGLSNNPSVGNEALDVEAKARFEDDPTDFAQLVLKCTGTVDSTKECVAGIHFKPRKLIAIGTSAPGAGDIDPADKHVFRRAVPVNKSGNSLTDCITAFAGFKGIQCWAYQGESIKNLHLYL